MFSRPSYRNSGKCTMRVGDIKLRTVITGSGGLSLSNLLDIPFEQEVVTCSAAVEALIPETDVAIELGGEDAKITFTVRL